VAGLEPATTRLRRSNPGLHHRPNVFRRTSASAAACLLAQPPRFCNRLRGQKCPRHANANLAREQAVTEGLAP